jgi:ferredoxin/coenzyme F420-reducing hydrogenase delta subunit
LLGQDHSPGEKKRFFVHCHRAEQQKHALLLPCLGSITENLILGVALAGFDEVVLTKGTCSQCHFQPGEQLLTKILTTSRVLSESMGLGQFAISLKEEEKKRGATLSRREIFCSISNRFKNKAASFSPPRETALRATLAGAPARKQRQRPTRRRELLRRLLKQRGVEKAAVVKYHPEFPWGKICIDENNCSACGTCVALCPTGAISQQLIHESYVLYYKSALCTNCALCQEACPQHAIAFEAEFALTDLLEDRAKVVARIQLAACVLCGDIILAGDSPLCPTCQKRQVWPGHVKV